MAQIKHITNKKIWDSFLLKTSKKMFPFFQSWDWGEVQKRLGFSVTRVGIYKDTSLIGVTQIIEVNAKRGKYLHLRHGPVMRHFTKADVAPLLTYLKKMAREKGYAFVRMSPLIEKSDKKQFLQTIGFRNAPVHNMDAETCWVLDLRQSEETLLANMRKSHRYLIKKAEKEPIEIVAVTKASGELVPFLTLYNKLAQKRGFAPHKGLAEELEVLGENNEAILFVAKYNSAIVGGALIDFVGNMAVYHHGATDDAYRDVPIAYLLQWHAIKEAKRRGKTFYNFWGIAPTDSKKHPWYGLSLFKMGFGGEKWEFRHAIDLPLSFGYWKNYAVELLFKLRRGY